MKRKNGSPKISEGQSRLKMLLIITVVLVMLVVNLVFAAENNYRPFDREVMVMLLQQTITAKLIPYQIKNNGLVLTITKINGFTMDWDKAQFNLDCSFMAEYNQGFIKMNQAGQVLLSGNGLIAQAEQRIGLKLLQISSIKLQNTGAFLNETIRIVLDKGLSGKEFWSGKNPAVYEILTKDNLAALLMVALNQALPITGADGNSTVTLTKLNNLSFMPTPGKLEAAFELDGSYQKLLTIPFSGQAAVLVDVVVDPVQMAGIIRIEQLKELQLKNSPGFLNGIIKSLVNSKIQGKELQFSWK